MSVCTHPTCHKSYRHDPEVMFLEYVNDEAWVPVCIRHRDDDNPSVGLDEETYQMDTDDLEQFK